MTVCNAHTQTIRNCSSKYFMKQKFQTPYQVMAFRTKCTFDKDISANLSIFHCLWFELFNSSQTSTNKHRYTSVKAPSVTRPQNSVSKAKSSNLNTKHKCRISYQCNLCDAGRWNYISVWSAIIIPLVMPWWVVIDRVI